VTMLLIIIATIPLIILRWVLQEHVPDDLE
jgi:hypothetical protein